MWQIYLMTYYKFHFVFYGILPCMLIRVNSLAISLKYKYLDVINKYMPLSIYLIILFTFIYNLDPYLISYLFDNIFLNLVVLSCLLLSSLYTLYLLTIDVNPESNKLHIFIKNMHNYFKLFYQKVLDCKTWYGKLTYVLFVIIGLFVFIFLQIILACMVRNYFLSFYGITMTLNNFFPCILLIFAIWYPYAFICKLFIQWVILLSDRYNGIYHTTLNFSPYMVKSFITREGFALKLIIILLGNAFRTFYTYDVIKSTYNSRQLHGLIFYNDSASFTANSPSENDSALLDADNPALYEHFVIGNPINELVDHTGKRVNVAEHYKQDTNTKSLIPIQDIINQGYTMDETGAFVKHTNNVPDLVYYTHVNKDQCISSTLAKSNSTKMLNDMSKYSLPTNDIMPAHPLGLEFMKQSNLVESYSDPENKALILQARKVAQYPNVEFEVKALNGPILNHYFKLKYGFLATTEHKSGIGQVDLLVKTIDENNCLENMVCGELKSLNGDSWTLLMKQASEYAEHDNDITNPGVICVKGLQIAFFMYEQDWHSSKDLKMKGKDFDGLVPIYVNKHGVDVLPQQNTFAPQAMFYNMYSDNPNQNEHTFAIHTLFRFFAMSPVSPSTQLEPSYDIPPKTSIAIQARELHPFVKEQPFISTVKTNTGTLGLGLRPNGKYFYSSIVKQ